MKHDFFWLVPCLMAWVGIFLSGQAHDASYFFRYLGMGLVLYALGRIPKWLPKILERIPNKNKKSPSTPQQTQCAGCGANLSAFAQKDIELLQGKKHCPTCARQRKQNMVEAHYRQSRTNQQADRTRGAGPNSPQQKNQQSNQSRPATQNAAVRPNTPVVEKELCSVCGTNLSVFTAKDVELLQGKKHCPACARQKKQSMLDKHFQQLRQEQQRQERLRQEQHERAQARNRAEQKAMSAENRTNQVPPQKGVWAAPYQCSACKKKLQIGEVFLVNRHVLCQHCHTQLCRQLESQTAAHPASTGKQASPPAPDAPTAMQMVKDLFAANTTFSDSNFSDTWYVIDFLPAGLPLCYIDTLCLFSSKENAETKLKKCVTNDTLLSALALRPVAKADIPAFLEEMYCCGYKNAIMDAKKVTLTGLEPFPEGIERDPGTASLCNCLIFCKETIWILRHCDEAKPGQLESTEASLTDILSHASLLLPTHKDNPAAIPAAMKDGTKWAVLFTDKYAVRDFYGKDIPCRIEPYAVSGQLARIMNDDSFAGIVVNPSRQDLRIRKGAS